MPVQRARGAERGQRFPRQPIWYARLKNIQHFVRRPRLRGRRKLKKLVVVIASACGLDPFSVVVREILEGHRSTQRRRFGDDRLRNHTLIERLSALRLQQTKGARE